MAHPDDSQLAAFLDGRLSAADQRSVEQHVETCEVCCEAMSRLPEDTLSAQLREVETDGGATTDSTGLEPETEPGLVPAALIDHPRYRILEPLGKGGMGVVFKAEHRMMGRLVAIKVINAKLIEHPQAVARFRAEVQAAGRLSHPNIVQAYDAEQAGDVHFLAMEYVDGISLAELVRRKGPLPFKQAAAIVRKVAHGLHHAFKQGMVHRDIKPQNIMVSQEGKVRVLDFGLARLVRERDSEPIDALAPMDRMRRTADALTLHGSVLGTPDYIAPEQVEDSHSADTRSDIYSLGCTCFYLLTGQPPYAGGTIMEKLLAHTDQTPPEIQSIRDDVPDGLARLVARMMERSPDDRFQTPIELANACDRFLDNAEPSATPTLPAIGEATMKPGTRTPRPTNSAEDPLALPTSELPVLPPRQRKRKKRPTASNRSAGVILISVVGIACGIGGLVFGLAGLSNDSETTPDPVPRGRDSASHAPGESTAPEPTNVRRPAAQWRDLIAEADPSTADLGEWTRTDSELHVEALPWARLAVANNPPAEYDFEVSFTRRTGEDSIALIFVMNGHTAAFDIDAWKEHLAGFQTIDGLQLNDRDNPTRVEDQQLINGRRYTVLLEVRRDRINAFVDGQPLRSYEGDGRNLDLLLGWALKGRARLGLGAYDSETIFHSVRLRER